MNLAQQLLNRVKEKRKTILFIGDAMIDHWIHGHLEDCQDGCQKFMEESYYTTPGGVCNAATSITDWQVIASCPGVIGGNHKYRFIGKDNHTVFRWDSEHATKLKDVIELKQEKALSEISKSHAVLLSDYDKGFLTPELIQKVIAKCYINGIPCVADCKRGPEIYKGAILKGNAAWVYKHKANLLTKNLVVTFGHASPTVNGRSTPPTYPDVPCVNHVGAGDCFAAHLILALAYGFSLIDAATIAHSAGRVYVQFPHNRPPTPQEIIDDLESVRQ